MRIAIGSDHRGFWLKQKVVGMIDDMGYNYEDFGCYNEDYVDYPDIAFKVASVVASGDIEKGILICSTGIGMSIAANKVKGIRAALCCDAFSALRARKHNDANILCLGAEVIGQKFLEIVGGFLDGEFEGGRHKRRLNKIDIMEG
ncbi:MAG: ribose 5-phosphate isomerase B [Dehalococcoidia bacterium]|nr:MAG: ribose 5-phosphate isomerase B [Dehalococcoidia bacterium]